MTSIGCRYLIDNNTLIQLSRAQRGSTYFTTCVRIPSSVLEEAQALPDHQALTRLEYPTSPSVLQHLISVMATLAPNDFSLVDLYANEGHADPFLVACALDGRANEEWTLFPHTWVVVSDDKAVRQKAAEFELSTLDNRQFAERIDRAIAAP